MKCLTWGRAAARRLADCSSSQNYVNEQSDSGIARQAYGAEKYRRLVKLKSRYDPTNLFRLNQNIPPEQPEIVDLEGPRIVTATTRSDYAAFRDLVIEYANWCRARYKDDAWFVDKAFGHQSLEDELQKLSTIFGPPNGKTLLICSGDKYLGCGAYKRLDDTTCEMKRVFLRPETRGMGLGRTLCRELMRAAKAEGYHLMRLDTAARLVEAIKTYRGLGFHDCDPYNEYPSDLMPYVVFMEVQL